MVNLDLFLLPQDGRNSFSAPYRPSTFLCCILIILAAATIVTELLTELIIFDITTYCPTIYFAVQSIIRTRRQSYTGPADSKRTARLAVVLAALWAVTMMGHVFLWYINRKSAYSFIFLNPVMPGSEATLIMLYIALRHYLHEGISGENRIFLPQDDENTINETISSAPFPEPVLGDHEEVLDIPEGPNNVDTYQPSVATLVFSTSLTIFVAVVDAQKTLHPNSPFFWVLALIQTYLPTILVHLYIITRIIRHKVQTPEDLSAIAGFCFETIVLWIWTRAIAGLYFYQRYRGWLAIGVAETLLMIYLSTRYAISLSREATKYNQSGNRSHPVSHEEGPSMASGTPTHTDIQNTNTLENPPPEVYHPSIFVLFLGLTLCGMCVYIEISKEPHIGIPIAALVYAPTTVIFVHWTVQSFHHTYADLVKYERAVEWSIALLVLWVLTQAFYIFLWPINRYYGVAMNPYVRWPAIVVVGYVAVRYGWDRRLRERGQIALPPDDSQQNEGGVSAA